MNILKQVTFLSLFMLMTNCQNKEDAKHNKITPASPPIMVKVNQVDANTNTAYVTASGKVQTSKSADISTRMMGYVEKINVKVGDVVRKGQLLIVVNNSDLVAKKGQVQANIMKAQANYKMAKKDYIRFKNLFNTSSASQKELDDMTANYEMAKANLNAVQQMKREIDAQFAYANIRAPFSGVVTEKYMDAGAIANPGMPMLRIEGNQNGFDVVAAVAENEISKIKKGTIVQVMIKSMNKKVSGKVTEIGLSSKNTGGQYLVKVKLYDVGNTVLSGMYATVQFPVKKSMNTTSSELVLVPMEAIVEQGELRGIYTVSKSNKALLRWLRLGRVFGNQVEVLSGLSKGERYILSSKGKIYNGANIKIN